MMKKWSMSLSVGERDERWNEIKDKNPYIVIPYIFKEINVGNDNWKFICGKHKVMYKKNQ